MTTAEFRVDSFMGDISAAARCLAPAGFAEDVAQESAVKLWKWLEEATPNDENHVRMTARKIVRQTAMETAAFEHRKKRDSRRTVGGGIAEELAVAAEETADCIADIREAIDMLPASWAACMTAYLFGDGYETRTGAGRGMVNRSKKQLRLILESAGIYGGGGRADVQEASV